MSVKDPTSLQLKAIESSGKIVLKSCPGSGKTFVVANKMIREVSSWKHKNKGIALLSFTNVANNEVNRQIQYISNIRKIGHPHFVGTIDSFISQWIFLPFGHLIMGCIDKPYLIQESSVSTIEYAKKLWYGQCHASMCDPLDFYIDVDGTIKNLSKSMDNCTVIRKKPCVAFKNYCFARGYATYMDAVCIALKLLETREDIGRLLSRRFPRLIIDEAQDTSAYQMKIVDKLSEYGTDNIMIIGDPDQAIYEWRDADPSVFLDKYNNSDWDKHLLNENFRCSQKICDATVCFSTLEAKSIAVGDSADTNFKPLVLRYDPKDKMKAIDEFLKICRNEDINITPTKVAVLVRGKTSLFGKDYSSIDNLWQSRESRLLSEATYERDLGSNSRAYSLVEQTLFGIFIKSDYLIKDIKPEEIEKTVSIDIWQKSVLEFISKMPSVNTQLSVWAVATDSLINTIALKYGLVRNPNVKIKLKTKDSYCSDFLSQPIKCFYAKSDELEYMNSTIHAVKGMTFEAVLLLLSTTGKLTAKMINTKPIMSEEIRTAYVAMTRAKKILVVAIPNTVKVKDLVRFQPEYWDVKDVL